MVSETERAALALQKHARGYLERKMGVKSTKGAKKGKVKNNKSDDMNAQVIQAAYRKYQAFKRSH